MQGGIKNQITAWLELLRSRASPEYDEKSWRAKISLLGVVFAGHVPYKNFSQLAMRPLIFSFLFEPDLEKASCA